jgi:hypothetical protein
MKFKILTIALTLSAAFSSKAQTTVDEDLQAFQNNSQEFMGRLPPKWGAQQAGQYFGSDEIQNRDYVGSKDQVRSRLCSKNPGKCEQPPRERILGFEEINESVQAFLETSTGVDNVFEMDKMRKGALIQKPWSDWFWPIGKGILGYRYADENFIRLEWLEGFQYIQNQDIFVLEDTESLSPSEKYDFVTGDQQTTLTKRMWQEGKYYHDAYGKIETWMGICHGWAPASYMLDRPARAVTVLSANRVPVKFYPSDIKALASLLWANAQVDTLFVGGRCSDKNPKVDEFGRIIDSTCFDVNPGSWHLALVNRISAGKTFVFDASYDYEVWNQPVLSYHYSYFNPATLKTVSDLEAAIVEAGFEGDKFKKHRSPNSKKIVGITLELKYLAETSPSQNETDRPERDATTTVRYLYDLELDESGKIIGGEWYNSAHPDFMWTPPLHSKAKSPGDVGLTGGWNTEQAFPARWKGNSVRAAGSSMPLGRVVETLIRVSNKPR